MKSNICKIKLHLLLFTFCIIAIKVIFPNKAFADSPIPIFTGIPCGSNGLWLDEFHSLRPYQTNTKCETKVSDYASFCGNDLTLKETISVKYPGTDTNGECVDDGTHIYCKYNVSVTDQPVVINLSNANLPIMGNTEDVINYKNTSDSAGFNDSEKMSNYVSWYLNGTTERKEYPKETDNNSVVNFSGPLAKLLPGVIQEAQRRSTVENGVKSLTLSFGNSLKSGLLSLIDPVRVQEIIHALVDPNTPTRHDQVVVCSRADLGDSPKLVIPPAFKILINKLLQRNGINVNMDKINTISDLLTAVPNLTSTIAWTVIKTPLEMVGVGKRVAVECPDSSVLQKVTDYIWGVRQYRLSEWSGSLSTVNALSSLFGKIGLSILDLFQTLFPTIPVAKIEEALDMPANMYAWDSRIPPLPWDTNPATNKQFTALEYQKAYNEWSGENCLVIPVFHRLICIDTFLTSDSYSNLFKYVPLSSTEDVKGNIIIDAESSKINTNNGSVVSDIKFTDQTGKGKVSSTLYFSHLEETNQLGDLLQSTYVPKGEDKIGTPTNISSQTSCNQVEVRSNKGDNLFASSMTGKLSFNASFTCVYKSNTFSNPYGAGCHQLYHAGCYPSDWTCESSFTDNSCGAGFQCGKVCTPPVQTCNQDVYITLTTQTNTPLINDIWSRLVAGPMSIFKMIFPKTNTVGSVGKIMDIAGSTGITYSVNSSTTNTNGAIVSNSGQQISTDLKFPHIGGISEYFLKGIQTALRPKGYGYSLTFDDNSDNAEICDSNCRTNAPNVDMTGVKNNFVKLANNWLGKDVKGNPRIDMFDTVVSTAQSAGLDPIFVLAIWIHESDASNYLGICNKLGLGDPNSVYCQKVQDFGVNDSSIETYYDSNGKVTDDHFLQQLQAFVNLPDYYKQICNGNKAAKCPLEYFFAMYYFGQCEPLNQTNEYGASIKSIYSQLTNQKFACYPSKI